MTRETVVTLINRPVVSRLCHVRAGRCGMRPCLVGRLAAPGRLRVPGRPWRTACPLSGVQIWAHAEASRPAGVTVLDAVHPGLPQPAAVDVLTHKRLEQDPQDDLAARTGESKRAGGDTVRPVVEKPKNRSSHADVASRRACYGTLGHVDNRQ